MDLKHDISINLLEALGITWNNIHMNMKVTTSDIYRTVSYAARNIPDTTKMNELNETERKVLRITSKTKIK